jgi:hypothetical protein
MAHKTGCGSTGKTWQVHHRQFSEARKAAIIRLVEQDLTIDQMAAEMHIEVSHMRNLIYRHTDGIRRIRYDRDKRDS